MKKLSPVIFLLIAFGIQGCDKPELIAPDRAGERGESCEARNDCESGLACVYNVCVVNEFDIDPTAQHCEVIECSAAEDCCEPPWDVLECEQLEMSCLQGEPWDCNDFLNNCACEYQCVDNQCRYAQPCFTSDHCYGGGECSQGYCDMSCGDNDDCFEGTICIDGACIDACEDRNDCPYFYDCQDNVCVEVGCDTDRECAAATGNALAECKDDECAIPCENDAECNDSYYQFNACISGLCVYVGCDSDEECRIYLGIEPGSDREAVCVDD